MEKFKKIISLCVIFILALNINASLATTFKKDTTLEIKRLQEKIDILEEKNNLIIKKLNLSQNIVERQDETINRYISWLSILIATIGLIIPLISYLFVIKPLSDAKNKFNSFYNQLSKEKFNEHFKKSIALMKSKNVNDRNRGYKFIYDNRYEITRPKHILEIQELMSFSEHENIKELCNIVLNEYKSI